MKLADFDFHLPEDRIALRPVVPRDSARLLEIISDGLVDRVVSDLPDRLRAGDALLLNRTRVIPARLKGKRVRGDSVIKAEATLHRRLASDRWSAFMRPGKRLAPGDRLTFGETLHATLTDKGVGGEVTLCFDLAGVDLERAIGTCGSMPLPPYIASKRPEDEQDQRDYQTVYADQAGSVAAPTAGLHFTPDLIARLTAKGVLIQLVTLHVGAGTFLPVKVDDLNDHQMHAEYGELDQATADVLNEVHARGGRVICVGTTSLRLLESATDEAGQVQPFFGDTAIFIKPGYRFRATDGLMTNFHLPRSTLFVLVSALAGRKTMQAAYAHAIAKSYRFYSYGDASLIWRTDGHRV